MHNEDQPSMLYLAACLGVSDRTQLDSPSRTDYDVIVVEMTAQFLTWEKFIGLRNLLWFPSTATATDRRLSVFGDFGRNAIDSGALISTSKVA